MDPTNKFDRLALFRSHNNAPWMRILQIAMEANPEEACKAARAIIEGDRRIDAALEEIIASHSPDQQETES